MRRHASFVASFVAALVTVSVASTLALAAPIKPAAAPAVAKMATPAAMAKPATPAASAKAVAPAASAKAAELVDLNSAARADLVKLPGVSEVMADKIIAGRPWKSKLDLVTKKLVTRSAYDKFSSRVITKQAGK